MDDQHLVQFRFVLRDIQALKIKHPHGDTAIIRKGEGPFLVQRANGTWMILPEREGRGLPETQWEDLWGDEKIDVEINLGDGWKTISEWEELNAVPIQLRNAAE